MVKSLIKMISSPNNAPEIGETGLVKNDKFRLNRPGFDAHFVMCEPRALARLLSVVLCFCLRQRTPLKAVHEALCVVAVDPCLSDLLEVSQCSNRPVRNGEPSLYTRSSKPDGCLG